MNFFTQIHSIPTTRRNTLLLFSFCLLVSTLSGSIGTSEAAVQLPPPPDYPASTDWNEVQYVIVTTTELQSEFRRLADWRCDHGLSSTVVTVDWIEDVAPQGADLQKTIRNFLVLAHDQWGTRYLLIGGDWEAIPSRIVWSDMSPYPEFDHLEFPSDLYFACLDGTWDADGDGIYAEFSTEGDDPDLEPELAVGRAPVETLEESEIFVNKVIAHDSAVGGNYLNQALFLGEVINPWDWQPGDHVYSDGGHFLDDYLPIFDGAQPICSVSRLYENYEAFPNAAPLNRQVTVDALASGNFNFVYHMGYGDGFQLSVGGEPADEFLGVGDVPAMVNEPNYFTIMSVTGPTACQSSSTLFEEMICSPAGGAVAAFGKTEIGYLASGLNMSEVLMENLYSPGNARLGMAHMQHLAEFSSQASTSILYHFAVLESVLLGDPAMHFRPGSISSVDEVLPSAPTHVAIQECSPNPFNPRTTIRFEVLGSMGDEYQASLEIFDVSGKRVASLLDESLEVGMHEMTWGGKDLKGKSVGSGVYFAVVQVAGQSAVEKVVLLK